MFIGRRSTTGRAENEQVGSGGWPEPYGVDTMGKVKIVDGCFQQSQNRLEEINLEVHPTMNSSAEDNPTANTGNPFAPPVELFHPPRLGIIHLLAWTAMTAVLLKLSVALGGFDLSPDDFSRALRIYFITYGIVYMMFHAACVVGTAVIIHARLRGMTGRLQAGHWVVVIVSVLLVVLHIIHFGWRRLLEEWFDISSSLVIGLSLGLLSASLWLIAAIRTREAIHWKAAFVFLVVRNITVVCAMIMLIDGPFWQLSFVTQLIRFPIGAFLMVFILCNAVLRDYFRHVKRDWLHGLGVTIVFTFEVLSIVNFLVIQLLH